MISVDTLIKQLIKESLEEKKSMPRCNEIKHQGKDVKICEMQDMDFCVSHGAQFTSENLEVYLSAPKDMQQKVWLTEFIATKGLSHCYYISENKPQVSSKETCKLIIAELSSALGISENFQADGAAVTRLAIINNSIMALPTTFEGKVLCTSNSHIEAGISISMSILENYHTLYWQTTELFYLLDTDDWKTLKESLEICANEKFNFNIYTEEMSSCIESIIPQEVRNKRSTLLSYLLGDGKSLDQVQNSVRSISKVMDSNLQNIAHNENVLKHSQQLQSDKLKGLSGQLLQTEQDEISQFWFIHDKIKIEQSANIVIINFHMKVLEAQHVGQQIAEITKLAGMILLHEQNNECTMLSHSYGCIDVSRSRIIFNKEDPTFTIILHFTKLVRKEMQFISCLPESSQSISIFHNKHGLMVGNDLHVQELIIKLEDLKESNIVNLRTREIDMNSDFLQGNIMMIHSPNRIGFYCVKPEIIFYDNSRINCTQNVAWKKKSNSDILSAKGLISFGAQNNLQLQARKTFMKSNMFSENLEGSALRERINANSSVSVGNVVLNKLRLLSPIQAAALSFGFGAFLILTCVLTVGTVCCIKKRKQSAPGTLTEQADPAQTQRPMTSQEVADRTREVLSRYMTSLRGRATVPTQE